MFEMCKQSCSLLFLDKFFLFIEESPSSRKWTFKMQQANVCKNSTLFFVNKPFLKKIYYIEPPLDELAENRWQLDRGGERTRIAMRGLC